MPIIVSNIRLGIDDNEVVAIDSALKKLRVGKSKVERAYIYKKSLDARRRGNISFVVSVVVKLFENEAEIAKAISDPFISFKQEAPLEFVSGNIPLKYPIAVVGFGPAGIFAAYTLAQQGYRPIIFERGSDIEQRAKSVDDFWTNAKLNTEDNVQFGEGGAGAFSDGKLTTRISDTRCEYVLKEFVRNGAPKEILTTAKPHIGTDLLRNVIKSMREEIIRLGGEIRFNSKIEDIIIENNAVKGLVVGGEVVETNNVVLAVGHSARDTFKLLLDKNVAIESKDFSVGVRIEQLQSTIDKGLYGDLAGHRSLPCGEYQLSHKQSSVYTFCMCPGGYVVPSSSESETVVVNGMSYNARDGKNANSAVAVSVGKQDYGCHPLDGVRFQQQLEQSAFVAGGKSYKAPFMTVGDFLNGTNKNKITTVTPTYQIGVTPADLTKLLPERITSSLQTGLKRFNAQLKGFSAPEGILTGVETRTSSPVRILRGEGLCSISVEGLYPCGEGAGYAGGIMSAAVDGIKVAQQLISLYKPS